MSAHNLLGDDEDAYSTWIKWKYKCASDGIKREIILDSDDGPPTHCYDNSAHAISGTPIKVEQKESREFRIHEESKSTEGFFQSVGYSLTAGPLSSATKRIFYPFGISIYNMGFNSSVGMEDDDICCTINAGYPIGVLTASITPATAWAVQNYVVGDQVTLTHGSTSPFNGTTFTYTCIKDTLGNALPTDVTYWRHGYCIDVDAGILTSHSCHIGWSINLDDGVNSDDCGMVVKIDSLTNQIWLDNTPTNSFSAGTYIKITLYIVPDRKVGPSGPHEIGTGKIGASFLEAFNYVDITYKNNHASETRTFVGDIDITYGREAGT